MRNVTKIFLTIAAVLYIQHAEAQVSLGVKLGVNVADTRVDGLIDNLIADQTKYSGYTAGIMAEIPITDALSFRPELNYIQKGFVVAQSFDVNLLGIDMPIGAKAKTRINYVEMPLLMKYTYGNDQASVYAIAGPNIAYATSASLRPVASIIIDFNLPRVDINLGNDIYNRMELSGVLGAGGEVKAGHGKIFSDVRYNLGFTNMLNNPIVDLRIKNQGFNITAGYAYTF